MRVCLAAYCEVRIVTTAMYEYREFSLMIPKENYIAAAASLNTKCEIKEGMLF